MNKIGFIQLGILLILGLQVFAENKSVILQQRDTIIFGVDLSKKNYYEKLFTKDERKQLKKANTYLESAKKYMLDYHADRRKIEELYTIAEATSSGKSREKSLIKARKLEPKALKKGFKSLDYYTKANDTKIMIYTSALNKIRLNDKSKYSQFGREIEMQAKGYLEEAKNKAKSTPQAEDNLRFSALNEANSMTNKALAMQETVFTLYMKDPIIDPIDYDISKKNIFEPAKGKIDTTKTLKPDSALFPVYVEQYNPLSDPNLYKSRASIILPMLKLTEQEKAKIQDANRKNQHANDLMKKVEEAYLLVDSLNYTAERTKDIKKREKIKEMAVEKEQIAFYNLTNASNIYTDVNDIKYNIYKAHYPKIDQKKMTPEIETALGYQNQAEELYLKAKNEIALANKQAYRSEQYIQLMGANDMLLSALQLQENAHAIYLNLPGNYAVVTDTAFSGKNKKVVSNIPVDKEKTSKNLSWDVTSTYTYSKEKPKAIPYKTKKGVVFLVQLGIFKGIIPAEKFDNIQPVVFDEFSANPYRRFMVGEYRSSEAAEAALESIKKAGYPDAYLISMVDGQRKSYSAGKEKITASDDHYNYLKRTELAKISGDKDYIPEEDDELVTKTGQISGNSIKNTKGLVYMVQLGMYQNPISYEDLSGFQPIYTDKIPDKGTRYLTGPYSTLSKAREESQRAVDKGMKDAYVIAYHNGEHVSLDKAKKLDTGKAADDTKVSSGADIAFMVQVGAYREKLSAGEEEKFNRSYSPRSIETRYYDGMNIYTIGNYKTYKDADFLKKKLVSEGHEGIFVVAFNGDKKIPIDQAIKLNKNN